MGREDARCLSFKNKKSVQFPHTRGQKMNHYEVNPLIMGNLFLFQAVTVNLTVKCSAAFKDGLLYPLAKFSHVQLYFMCQEE